MENKRRVLWKLFVSTLYLSAFTFGGCYVIVSLLKKKFVDEYHWIENEEMLDLVAIAQSSPGAIAVNGAIVVGYKLAGMAGTVIAILGTIIPPFLIISAISVFYNLIKDKSSRRLPMRWEPVLFMEGTRHLSLLWSVPLLHPVSSGSMSFSW